MYDKLKQHKYVTIFKTEYYTFRHIHGVCRYCGLEHIKILTKYPTLQYQSLIFKLLIFKNIIYQLF